MAGVETERLNEATNAEMPRASQVCDTLRPTGYNPGSPAYCLQLIILRSVPSRPLHATSHGEFVASQFLPP